MQDSFCSCIFFIIIHNFIAFNGWKNGRDYIIDVRATDLESVLYIPRKPAKVLASHEQQKMKKYLDECLHQRRSFSPFVISTDGLCKDKNLLKQLALHFFLKLGTTVLGCLWYMLGTHEHLFELVTNACLRGSRIPFSKISRHESHRME